MSDDRGCRPLGKISADEFCDFCTSLQGIDVFATTRGKHLILYGINEEVPIFVNCLTPPGVVCCRYGDSDPYGTAAQYNQPHNDSFNQIPPIDASGDRLGEYMTATGVNQIPPIDASGDRLGEYMTPAGVSQIPPIYTSGQIQIPPPRLNPLQIQTLHHVLRLGNGQIQIKYPAPLFESSSGMPCRFHAASL